MAGVLLAAAVGFVFVRNTGIDGLGLTQQHIYVEAVQKAAPSVVSIRSRSTSKRTNLLERFFGFPDLQGSADSLGSAVILDGTGYLITSSHTIQGATQIQVELLDGREMTAQLIGKDRLTDLAVLKVDATDALPPIELGSSETLRVGDTVLAIGNPFGVGQTVTSGIVSALGRETRNPYLQMIQTDAAINPGNSGGALINTSGQLVGIASLLVSNSGSWAGIGYAIPVELVVQVVKDLVQFGSVQRGWLGYMEIRDLNIFSARQERETAVLIRRLDAQGPLAIAGLQNGDIIRYINDQPASSKSLRAVLTKARPKQPIRLAIQRSNTQFNVQVHTVQHPGI